MSQEASPPTERGFAVVNGTRLYYEVAGAGPAVVLLHGFTLDTTLWDAQWAPFAAAHRVVRYDARGFGQSAVPTREPYRHVDDLRALLAELGVARAALVGLSMGGGIAIDFALAYPHLTTALLLVDATLGGYRWDRELARSWGRLHGLARREGVGAAKAAWLALPQFVPAYEQPAVATALARLVARYSGWGWLNDDPGQGVEPPAVQRLGELGCPVLAVVGARDLPDFLAIADLVARQTPGARRVVLPGVGHLANLEAPERFNAVALAFLNAVAR